MESIHIGEFIDKAGQRFRPGPPTETASVLVVGGAGYGVLAAVRALRAAGYVPWLATSNPGTYASRSWAAAGIVIVPDPELDWQGFVHEMSAAAVRLAVSAVLPSTETDLYVLADRKADFGGIILGVPSRECVDRATNKALLPELARAAGLLTPPTQEVNSSNSRAVEAFGFPAIVKPLRSRMLSPNGSVSIGSVHYVLSEEQAKEVLRTFPDGEGLMQPYIRGQLISISGVSWEGELVCAVHQAAIRTYPFPVGTSSYAKTTPPDLELERGVRCLLQALGWSGIFQAQFLRVSDDKCYLIDLNPRIYGSLALAISAGLNLPEIWADLLLGRKPKIGPYRIGACFRQEEKDFRMLARKLLEGECFEAFVGLVPRRGTAHAIFALHDPMPVLTSVAKFARSLKL